MLITSIYNYNYNSIRIFNIFILAVYFIIFNTCTFINTIIFYFKKQYFSQIFQLIIILKMLYKNIIHIINSTANHVYVRMEYNPNMVLLYPRTFICTCARAMMKNDCRRPS